jgi:hypothetical protein
MVDPKEINWAVTTRQYIYGLQKFVLKQDVFLPDYEVTTLVRKNSFEYFEDLRWAFFNGSPILQQDLT